MPASALLALAVAVGAPPAKDPPKPEAALVGEWVAEKVLVGGSDVLPALSKDGIRLAFDAAGKATMAEGKKKSTAFTYKLDAKADPPKIDLTPAAGARDAPYYGVFKVDGDTLTLAMTDTEADRPAKVEGFKGQVWVLRRAKKKD